MRVLCTCLPGHGHFLPVAPLARALAAAGHDVAFATAADFCPKIEAGGFPAFPAGMSLPDQLEQAGRRYPESQLPPGKQRFEEFVPLMLAGVAAPPRAADLVPVIEKWRPDVLVHDETELAGPVAAAVAGIPWVDQSVGILRPLPMLRRAGRALDPLCRQWDVDVGEFAGLFRHLYLDVCPPTLQNPEIGEIAVARPVHNLSVEGGTAEPPPWLGSLPPRPTVYVSLGTIFNRDPEVFGSILAGVAREPVNVIATIGPDADPAALGRQPENVHIEDFVPQALLLPHCDVVVNQGGTAILDILGHGLPLLVLPRGANQFHNAEACVASGAARALMPGDVTAESVSREVHTLLTEPAYRSAAAAIAEELAGMPGPAEGVHLVEELVEQHQVLGSGR